VHCCFSSRTVTDGGRQRLFSNHIKQKGETMNYRRGMFRVWVVVSALWVIGSAVFIVAGNRLPPPPAHYGVLYEQHLRISPHKLGKELTDPKLIAALEAASEQCGRSPKPEPLPLHEVVCSVTAHEMTYLKYAWEIAYLFLVFTFLPPPLVFLSGLVLMWLEHWHDRMVAWVHRGFNIDADAPADKGKLQ
jgi:hypothetical protein